MPFTLAAARALRAAADRRQPASLAALAQRLDPKFVVTPAIALLSDIAVRSVTAPDQRDVVTTPSRTGKSRLLAVWTPVWALARNPDLNIIVISYSDELAQAHSRESGASSPSTPTCWAIEGHRGGVLAGGIQSGATGLGADPLIIDDPYADAQ